MEVSVERARFLKALSHAQSVVEKKTTIPILSHVLLKACSKELTLTTTDMDLALIENIEASVETPGRVTVSAYMLFEIVRKLPHNELTLKLDPTTYQLTITCGKSCFYLSCLPADEYPSLTQTDLPFRLKLSHETFALLIDKTRFAMSTDETRPYLNGIYFHPVETQQGSFLRAVATDGHRLACIECPFPQEAEVIPEVIIGRKAIHEIRKLLEEETKEIEIGLSHTRIEVVFDKATLTSRLIEGQFPDYEKAIPQDNHKILIIRAKKLTEAVDRVATVATSDKIRVVKLNLSTDQLILSALSQDVGRAQEELVVDYAADTLEIGFNARYLLDISQQISTEEAQISLHDENTAAVIKGLNDNQAIYVLMPLRI